MYIGGLFHSQVSPPACCIFLLCYISNRMPGILAPVSLVQLWKGKMTILFGVRSHLSTNPASFSVKKRHLAHQISSNFSLSFSAVSSTSVLNTSWFISAVTQKRKGSTFILFVFLSLLWSHQAKLYELIFFPSHLPCALKFATSICLRISCTQPIRGAWSLTLCA